MANRSYLYSTSNRPESYEDRPETVSGLSEWPYAIPFSFLVLLSGDPRLCASLIADGFDGEPPESRTTLYAISGEFDAGFARLTKFAAAVRAVSDAEGLHAGLAEAERFLDAHRDRYVLLETVELDTMIESGEDELRALIEGHLDLCRAAGAAIDALPDDAAAAGAVLAAAAAERSAPPLDAFHGLVLTDDFDNTRDDRTENPIGLSWWTDVLYFALWNRAEYAANQPNQ
ncbi:hypothetical protein [Lentzea sp. NPDC059081]|uniref:DUF7822 domain-containing protein n=1 Tax=Lentzea sp. NPDC059081 TaxID=3346719 RepID=UPI0036913072